jgi:hypothetical protein
MAHKLLFDNVSTRSATLNDGTVSFNSETEVYSFADGTTITNEDRVIDRNFTNAITNFASGDALQFDFGSAKTIDFVALYFNAAETDSIRIHYDDAATGNTTEFNAFTDNYAVGWNIRTFTSTSARYWIVGAASGTVDGITEIFFGSALELPVDGAGITIDKPYNSFIGSTYNNTEFSNKIDTELREWTLQLPIITESDKTDLELLISDYSNLYTFVYYDESEYHTVRLARPLTFNQVATNTYSTNIRLREEG